MRHILAISLSIILLVSCCKDIGTYASFYANQDFIAKIFCVNKDDANSCCAGKCYLTKKLAKGKSDKNNPSPVSQSDIKQQQYIPLEMDSFVTSIRVVEYSHKFHYRMLLELDVVDYLLRPPILS